MWRLGLFAIMSGVLLSGCVVLPTGPSVMVLPGSGKDFEQFKLDDAVCREWAAQQTGTTTTKAANENAAQGAVVGTVVGAAAGAALGAASGHPASGAAVGSGLGLLGGATVGAGNAASAQGSVQHRYDMAYVQCMYSKGNQVPVSAGYRRRVPYSPPPGMEAPPDIPPPPPGSPPPPPPGAGE